MIAQFIDISNHIKHRGIILGRSMIQYRHFATRNATFLLFEPSVGHIEKDYVGVIVGSRGVIGTETEDPIQVLVPVPLFETGDLGDIKTWITRQNNAWIANEEQGMLEIEAKERNLLRELLRKYPGEMLCVTN